MIAHLQNGRYDNARILQEETAKEMHRRQFGHDPRVNGLGYGFWQDDRNDQRIIGWGGDTDLTGICWRSCGSDREVRHTILSIREG
jgi:hypothetical protein